jgi:hypothetical protein
MSLKRSVADPDPARSSKPAYSATCCGRSSRDPDRRNSKLGVLFHVPISISSSDTNHSLPLDVPKQPAFGREIFRHEIKTLAKDLAYDDKYEMNTQSGTQWDGFRHISYFTTAEFYNGVRGKDIVGPDANLRDSIHHWADHGIAGRGILVDYRSYAKSKGINYGTKPIDMTNHIPTTLTQQRPLRPPRYILRRATSLR